MNIKTEERIIQYYGIQQKIKKLINYLKSEEGNK
jgi:hypothetical protein